MTKLAHLPSEIIPLILYHVTNEMDLYTCALINKLFYNETMPQLWRQLTITSLHTLTKITSTMTTSPHKPGQHVQHVALLFHNLSDMQLFGLIGHVPRLEHLQLSSARYITDISFQHMTQKCPHLTTLILPGAYLQQSSMMALGQDCHQLHTLVLDTHISMDSIKLFPAIRGCPLKNLVFNQSCYSDDNAGDIFFRPAPLSENAALALCDQHQLVSLKIHDTDHDYTPLIRAATTLSTLSTASAEFCWPHLTCLELNPCDTLDDHLMIPFLQQARCLEALELGGSKITDQTLDAIPVYLPTIQRVALPKNPGLTGGGLCRLVKNCTSLNTIVICVGCDIFAYDEDFPARDLDDMAYMVNGSQMVVYLAADAFGKNKGGR